MITNPYYHLENTAGDHLQLPPDTKPGQVSASLGRTLVATPDSDNWWLEGRKRIKPYNIELRFLLSCATEDEVRFRLTQYHDYLFDAVRLWRDINWYRDIHSGGDFTFEPAGGNSTLWNVTLTVSPKGPYAHNASTDERSVIL